MAANPTTTTTETVGNCRSEVNSVDSAGNESQTTESNTSVAVTSVLPSTAPEDGSGVVVAEGNLFEELKRVLATATTSQMEKWAPKILKLEVADQKRGLPLSGVSKGMVEMVRDYVDSHHPEWTMKEFQAEYVKRLAAPFKCSLLNLMQGVLGITCQQATVFVSHAWRYNNSRFFSCVCDLESTEDAHFWIDALTVNQFHSQHGFDWWSTTFQDCIAKIQKTVLILFPYSNPIPLTRAWCLFEIFCTDRAGIEFDVAMDKAEVTAFHAALSDNSFDFRDWVAHIDLSKAEAFDDSDKANILAAVKNDSQSGGIHGLNKRVIALLRQWLTEQVQSITTVPRHDDYFAVVVSKGRFLISQGRSGEAETLFRELVQETKNQQWPEYHLLVAMSWLAEALRRQRKLQEAESVSRQCVTGLERTVGATHHDTLKMTHSLALVLRLRGKLSESESLYRAVLASKQSTVGVDDPSSLLTMNQLGVVLLLRKKFEEAETLFRKALTLQQKLKGEGHPDTLATLSHLAAVVRRTGRLDEAEGLRREELRISEEKLGPLNPETLTSINNLAGLLDVQGKFEEAEQLYRRALTGRRQALGPTHPDTLQSVGNLAIFLEGRGKLVESEALYCLVIAAADDKPEEAVHPDTWYCMAMYADYLRSAGRIDEAVTFCARALGAQERTLGRDHPETKESIEVMGLIQEAAQSSTNDTATTSTTASVEQ